MPREELTVLKCPGCGAKVADDAVICPACDFIIDATAFSSEPPEADDASEAPTPLPGDVELPGDVTDEPTPPPGKAPKKGEQVTQVKRREEIEAARTLRPREGPQSAKRPAVSSRPTRRKAAGAKPRRPTPAEGAVEDWHVRPSQPRAVHAESSAESSTGHSSPEEVIADLWHFVTELSGPDKLAFVGAAINLLLAFFPWKETVLEGDVLGVMSAAFPVFLLSVAIIAAIAVRTRELAPRLGPMIPWLVQLLAGCLCVVWCLVFIRLAWDSRVAKSLIGNYETPVSRPAFGVFVAIIASALSVTGTVMGLKDRPP